MGSNGTGDSPLPPRRRRPRFIFQIDSDTEGTVIRVLDTHEGTVFREIPIEDFLAYAKKHKDVKAFLLGTS